MKNCFTLLTLRPGCVIDKLKSESIFHTHTFFSVLELNKPPDFDPHLYYKSLCIGVDQNYKGGEEMEKILWIIRYWLWDRWFGGESVSAVDVRRAKLLQGPDIEIGDLRIPRWAVLVLLAIIIGLLIVAVIIALTRVTFTTTEQLAGGDLVSTGECYARDSVGRNYVALDCLAAEIVRNYFFLVPAILIFVAGFFCGMLFQQWRAARR